jgi:hypothetical protein
MATGKLIMTALGTAPDIPYLKKTKILIMISIIIGLGILNGTKMIPGAIMTKRIIEPDIPRNIKTKRSYLISPGTGRDIKNEMGTFQESWWFLKCGCR